jgi:hypothetical protein
MPRNGFGQIIPREESPIKRPPGLPAASRENVFGKRNATPDPVLLRSVCPNLEFCGARKCGSAVWNNSRLTTARIRVGQTAQLSNHPEDDENTYLDHDCGS